MIIPERKEEKKTGAGIVLLPEDKREEAVLRGTVEKVGSNVNAEMKNGKQISAGDIIQYFPDHVVEGKYQGAPRVLVHKRAIVIVE